MHRHLLVSLTVALVALLVVPMSVQAAGQYTIRNAAGVKVGSASAPGQQTGSIWKASGSLAGRVTFYEEGLVFRGGTWDRRIAVLVKASSGRYDVTVGVGKVMGHAIHKGSRWVLEKLVKGTWKKRGSAPEKLAGPCAAGALRLLLW
jgi:hypothetical protein